LTPETRPTPRLSLREPSFFILLSLAPEAKHGYAILKDVEELSGGRLRLSTGTLYEALTRLLDQGLIERFEGENQAEANPGLPRKAYRLTDAGRRLLAAEAEHMQTLAILARTRLGEQST
jgi:DNA-binding PadR family transcriptional regulator